MRSGLRWRWATRSIASRRGWPGSALGYKARATPPPILFAHYFSSYCQKALIAFYESGVAFDYRLLGAAHPENAAELARRWPLGKFPVLADGGRTIVEATAIIEHLAAHHPGAGG